MPSSSPFIESWIERFRRITTGRHFSRVALKHYSTAARLFLRSMEARRVDVTVAQDWLDHVSLETAFLCAQAKVETKRKALDQADDDASPSKPPRWKREPAVLAWPDSL